MKYLYKNPSIGKGSIKTVDHVQLKRPHCTGVTVTN